MCESFIQPKHCAWPARIYLNNTRDNNRVFRLEMFTMQTQFLGWISVNQHNSMYFRSIHMSFSSIEELRSFGLAVTDLTHFPITHQNHSVCSQQCIYIWLHKHWILMHTQTHISNYMPVKMHFSHHQNRCITKPFFGERKVNVWCAFYIVIEEYSHLIHSPLSDQRPGFWIGTFRIERKTFHISFCLHIQN